MPNKYLMGHNLNDQQNDINKLNEAIPASGFRPETEEEWAKAQNALIAVGYASFQKSGLPKKKAKELAQSIYGGATGRMLLELTMGALGDE